MKKYYSLFLVFSSLILNAQCWEKTSCGIWHTAAIQSDGSLWAWGSSQYGQLGIGIDETIQSTNLNRNTPVQAGTDTNWQSVSCGWYHTAAIKTDGSLWSWGRNDGGEVGDGTMHTVRNVPVRIGTGNNWRAVSCSSFFTIGLKTDGTLWSWGGSSSGATGTDVFTYTTVPTQLGTDSNWQSISTGYNYVLAIKTDGSLWGWGENNWGQVGDGTNVDKFTPTRIGTSNNWASISAGYNHSLAITTEGKLYSWGANYYAQLGNGATSPSYVPILVNEETDWVKAKAGQEASFIIKSNGKLYHFGGGYGLNNRPTQISPDTDWQEVEINNFHAMRLKTSKMLYAEGLNSYGQLGIGYTNGNAVSTSVTCNALGLGPIAHSDFSMYPVPVKNKLNLDFGGTDILINFITITDMQGKVIFKSNENKTELDLSGLANGIYCIKIVSDSEIFSSKFIKE